LVKVYLLSQPYLMMLLLRLSFSFCLFLGGTSVVFGQKTLVERLGYPADARLLILHADDLGVAHAENTASFEFLRQGGISSASVMVPCPWLPEVAQFARQYPSYDLGLHLTLTSEWNPYKWGPVAAVEAVRSLTDSLGYFYDNCAEMAKKASPEAVRLELRAQIQKAKAMGIQPTHLDSHMGCLFFERASFFKIYLELGREFGIPVMLSREMTLLPDSFRVHLQATDMLVDGIITAGPDDYQKGLDVYYEEQLRGLAPGVYVLLVHLAEDTHEMQGMTEDYGQYPNWCAPWRKADYAFFASEKYKALLKERGIQLITWKELGTLLPGK